MPLATQWSISLRLSVRATCVNSNPLQLVECTVQVSTASKTMLRHSNIQTCCLDDKFGRLALNARLHRCPGPGLLNGSTPLSQLPWSHLPHQGKVRERHGWVDHRGHMLSSLLDGSSVLPLCLCHELSPAMASPSLRSSWREPPGAPCGFLIRLLAALRLCLPSWCLRMCAAHGHAVRLRSLLHEQQGSVMVYQFGFISGFRVQSRGELLSFETRQSSAFCLHFAALAVPAWHAPPENV